LKKTLKKDKNKRKIAENTTYHSNAVFHLESVDFGFG